MKRLVFAAALAALPTSAFAQVMGQAAPVQDANATVAGQAAAQQAGVAAVNLDAQAQYAADMDAYRASVRAQNRGAIRDQVRYDRQQRAYADAMVAWRMQVRACHDGHTDACNAPTPDPAAFY